MFVKDGLVGQHVQCPKCGKTSLVPSAEPAEGALPSPEERLPSEHNTLPSQHEVPPQQKAPTQKKALPYLEKALPSPQKALPSLAAALRFQEEALRSRKAALPAQEKPEPCEQRALPLQEKTRTSRKARPAPDTSAEAIECVDNGVAGLRKRFLCTAVGAVLLVVAAGVVYFVFRGSEKEPTGHLESVDVNEIVGWAWDPTQPNEPIKVDIFDNNKLVRTVLADQSSEKPLDAGNGKHWFSLAVPAAMIDGKYHTIRARVSGTKIELEGSPRILKLKGP
jgi:hypothetical protein